MEKKKMFMVWTLEVDALPEVVAYVDNGKIVCYRHDGDSKIHQPTVERFFDTEAEANDYIKERIEYFKSNKKLVHDILMELYRWEKEYPNGEAAIHLDDLLPFEIKDRYVHQDESRYREGFDRMARCARLRVLEIADKAIPTDNISHIEWQDRYFATIILLDGTRVDVKDPEEWGLLCMLYDHDKRQR